MTNLYLCANKNSILIQENSNEKIQFQKIIFWPPDGDKIYP